MARRIPRRKVFISFHEDDMDFKKRFVHKARTVIIDKSVDTGDIDDTGIKVATIRQKIRDDYIRDATVTIVLIGRRTWQRKHVDWDIGSSLRRTRKNPRCGLLGILLPNHSNYRQDEYDPHLIPPRLADNCEGDDPYALIYNWPAGRAEARLRDWINRAFLRRNGAPPNNGRRSFARNRGENPLRGWHS